MTDEQARRIAQLNARRSRGGSGRTTAGGPERKQHKARKSRAAVLGLSVAAASSLISGMWTEAAVAAAQPAGVIALAPATAAPTTITTTTVPPDVALQPNTEVRPVVIPGRNGQPDQVVYLVITRPSSSSGAGSLRSSSGITQTAQVPSQVTTTPRPTINTPVTRSHGSR